MYAIAIYISSTYAETFDAVHGKFNQGCVACQRGICFGSVVALKRLDPPSGSVYQPRDCASVIVFQRDFAPCARLKSPQAVLQVQRARRLLPLCGRLALPAVADRRSADLRDERPVRNRPALSPAGVHRCRDEPQRCGRQRASRHALSPPHVSCASHAEPALPSCELSAGSISLGASGRARPGPRRPPRRLQTAKTSRTCSSSRFCAFSARCESFVSTALSATPNRK